MTDSTPAVFTVAMLAKRWLCGRPTVLAAIHVGQLPAFRLGKRAWRVRLADVERYEEQRRAA